MDLGVTTNGVRVTVRNSMFTIREGDPPFLVFEPDGEGHRLVAINLDGYVIRPRTSEEEW